MMIFNFLKKNKLIMPFDKVYCISYCRNIEKQNNIRKIMKYFNINFDFILGADYNNLEILKHKDFVFFKGNDKESEMKINHFRMYTHFIGASYDHYTAIIHAYESGANSVLIMEDDCTFINDVSYIQWALNNYPKDADFVKFGYICRKYLKQYQNENYKFIYTDNLTDIHFYGSQLYGICNRKTMKKYIETQQQNFVCIDNILNYIDDIKIYGLIQPIALDYQGNKNDIAKGFENKYTLLENI